MRWTTGLAAGVVLLSSVAARAWTTVEVVTGEQVEQAQRAQDAANAPQVTTGADVERSTYPETGATSGANTAPQQNAAATNNARAPAKATAGQQPRTGTASGTQAAQPNPELQALREQNAQQAQQLQLLQQQLANQGTQEQSLNQVNQNLQGVQQQLVASQEQVAARDASMNQTLTQLDDGINRLKNASLILDQGTSDVDLTPLAESLPGQAGQYAAIAQQWLNIGDYYTARSYLDLATQLATQARVGGTALVPKQE